jgi:multidrug transporter EmrE-like cation transporter
MDTISGLARSEHAALISVTTVGAMVLLAGLDFIGAIFAKEWTERQHLGFYLAGAASFLLLYVVYAHALKTAELSIVTIGWVVLLQVGLVLVDRFRYGVTFEPSKWIAIVLILVLQTYLVLGPRSS